MSIKRRQRALAASSLYWSVYGTCANQKNHIMTLQGEGVTNAVTPNSTAEKIWRDTAAVAALIAFQTLAVPGSRVWRATEAIGRVISTSWKTGLCRKHCQTYRSNVIPWHSHVMCSVDQSGPVRVLWKGYCERAS